MTEKLLESVPSTNVKVIEIYNKIDSGSLKLTPCFQRKLVWKKQHKFHFIETILKNYPFPEVYIASDDMDVATITASEIVVDGQQRLSTIVDYIKGIGDFIIQNKITAFQDLEVDEKKQFLNYLISVRDLKNIDSDIVKEIFMRINNTEYSLNAIEKINAQYGDSEFVIFCKQIIDSEYQPDISNTDSIIDEKIRNRLSLFFSENKIFSENDSKRLNSLQFMMTLVSTLIESDFFSRNSKVNEYLEKYNSSFDKKGIVEERLLNAINVYSSLELGNGSYWLSRSNVFTMLIEFSNLKLASINIKELKNSLLELERTNKLYFAGIDVQKISPEIIKYFEYTKEAVNEKSAREHRSSVVKEIIANSSITVLTQA